MPTDRRLVARRGLFIGFNLCLLAALYLLTIRPLTAVLDDQADRLAHARATLARYSGIAAQEARVRTTARQLGEAEFSGAFLAGTSDGAISASLQARLKALADQAGARVQSVRALEPVMDHDIRYLGAHLELTGPIAAIHATLQAIEDRQPYLFVDTAAMRMPAAPAGVALAQEPSIEAQFDIYGPVRSHAAAH
jgi:hypothetical protein